MESPNGTLSQGLWLRTVDELCYSRQEVGAFLHVLWRRTDLNEGTPVNSSLTIRFPRASLRQAMTPPTDAPKATTSPPRNCPTSFNSSRWAAARYASKR